jgi:hypothetical protein
LLCDGKVPCRDMLATHQRANTCKTAQCTSVPVAASAQVDLPGSVAGQLVSRPAQKAIQPVRRTAWVLLITVVHLISECKACMIGAGPSSWQLPVLSWCASYPHDSQPGSLTSRAGPSLSMILYIRCLMQGILC